MLLTCDYARAIIKNTEGQLLVGLRKNNLSAPLWEFPGVMLNCAVDLKTPIQTLVLQEVLGVQDGDKVSVKSSPTYHNIIEHSIEDSNATIMMSTSFYSCFVTTEFENAIESETYKTLIWIDKSDVSSLNFTKPHDSTLFKILNKELTVKDLNKLTEDDKWTIKQI